MAGCDLVHIPERKKEGEKGLRVRVDWAYAARPRRDDDIHFLLTRGPQRPLPSAVRRSINISERVVLQQDVDVVMRESRCIRVSLRGEVRLRRGGFLACSR